MDAKLNVVLTQTSGGKPLMTVQNLPGEGADLTPAQARALAEALLAAAKDCEGVPMDRRTFGRVKRSYDMIPKGV
ncbi:MAG: hypothetical protein JNM98_21645 [Rhodocyclaceae bacterium]|nr:hypothetical protein [Rhodocyclaceae bacterium]